MSRPQSGFPGTGRESGLTLIELIIAVAIAGILLGIGVNSYGPWVANSRVRSSADSIQSGLLLAKTEAIRRNSRVQFVLTDTEPIEGNVNAIVASTAGRNWMVRIFQPGGAYVAADFVQGRSRNEAACTVVTANADNLIFTGLGLLNPVPGAMVSINVKCAGSSRPLGLNVTVGQGGAIRLCDPALAIANSPLGC